MEVLCTLAQTWAAAVNVQFVKVHQIVHSKVMYTLYLGKRNKKSIQGGRKCVVKCTTLQVAKEGRLHGWL